jgi:hypothetical protein
MLSYDIDLGMRTLNGWEDQIKNHYRWQQSQPFIHAMTLSDHLPGACLSPKAQRDSGYWILPARAGGLRDV